MMASQKAKRLVNSLENRLIDGKNKIIIEDNSSETFDIIQNYIERIDCPFKTPVIYYQAFSNESIADFLETLANELLSKLGHGKIQSTRLLSEIIKASELKIIIIDKVELQLLESFEDFLNVFSDYKVALILISYNTKLDLHNYQINCLPTTSSMFTLL